MRAVEEVRAEPNPQRVGAALRASFRMHLDRPLAVAVAVGAAISIFLVDHLTPGTLGAGQLGRLFAPPPLDSFADLQAAKGALLLAPFLIVARSAVLTGVLSILFQARPAFSRFVKVVAIEVAGAASLALIGLTGLFYLSAKSAAASVPGAGAIALFLIVLTPALHAAAVALFSPMACRAALGQTVRPCLADAPIWLFAVVSTWLWMFGSRRVEALASAEGGSAIGFALALCMVVAQSVVLAAIALRARETSPGRT